MLLRSEISVPFVPAAALVVAVAALSAGCGSKATSVAAAGPETIPVPARPVALEATRVYGPLTVIEGDFEDSADVKPWSGYWFPVADDILVHDGDAGEAPLRKFDDYASSAFNRTTHAASYEIDHHLYDPEADGWEGRCDAWALASLLEPEPVLRQPVKVGGVTFGTRDLKALLVKSYETHEKLPQFGQRYNGDRGDDFDDIYPDQFHRVLTAELYGKHKPFIMDTDPGVEVWNTPVYRAETRLQRDARDPHVMHVDTAVLGASEFVSPDFTGTQPILFEYTYDLYGIPGDHGRFDVKYGFWTASSVTNHPDFVNTLPDHAIQHASANKELDNAIVYDIVGRARGGR